MTARSLPADLTRESFVSVSVAFLISFLWLVSAYVALFVLPDTRTLPVAGVLATIAGRSFLHTGLFILAHDAMHGTLAPAYPRFNNMLGRIILAVYSFLSFDQMQAAHHQHHRTPAQPSDPDFYAGGFWPWYFSFMRTYLAGGQGWAVFWGMSALFYPMVLGLGVPVTNAVLFWLLPMAISSWQLFYFGTYRPHRRPLGGHTNAHRANSSEASPFWSFFSCYHFDYHWEHHQYPHLPWYKLPSMHQR